MRSHAQRFKTLVQEQALYGDVVARLESQQMVVDRLVREVASLEPERKESAPLSDTIRKLRSLSLSNGKEKPEEESSRILLEQTQNVLQDAIARKNALLEEKARVEKIQQDLDDLSLRIFEHVNSAADLSEEHEMSIRLLYLQEQAEHIKENLTNHQEAKNVLLSAEEDVTVALRKFNKAKAYQAKRQAFIYKWEDGQRFSQQAQKKFNQARKLAPAMTAPAKIFKSDKFKYFEAPVFDWANMDPSIERAETAQKDIAERVNWLTSHIEALQIDNEIAIAAVKEATDALNTERLRIINGVLDESIPWSLSYRHRTDHAQNHDAPPTFEEAIAHRSPPVSADA
ncbi:hypothetical protein BZG36_03929 [Bifiguratus adelaidae]|uniref:Uncharacterized protein n=1 Tax=Bifiguratus adelaidae TaxID=1938954 RepID=A0A261XZ55_9FUNG|nr:hypothetical protein BZG36_03929 [Bifiguratus adelaidae]